MPAGEGNRSPKEQLIRLLRFPAFWIGLLFLAYIAIGALNYSTEYTIVNEGKSWRMTYLPEGEYINWLPNGAETPFYRMNTWRVFINYSACLALVCTVWLGIERRKALFLVVSLIAFNVFFLSILGILQYLSDTKTIYWFFKSANRSFYGPFQYRNHGVIFAYLGMAASLSAAFHYWRMGARAKSTPAPLYLFFSFVVLLGLFVAGSGGGIFFGGLVVLSAIVIFIICLFRSERIRLFHVLSLVVISVIVTGLSAPILSKSLPELKARFASAEKYLKDSDATDASIEGRFMMLKITYEMWEDKKWFGWGAGSMRFIFPKYQYQYKEFYYKPWTYKRALKTNFKKKPVRQWVLYSHNDWIQSLAEYGIVGTGILVMALGFWLFLPLLHLSALTASGAMLYAGSLITLLHAIIDFPLYNQPILMLFVTTLALAGACVSIQSKMQKAD